MPLTAPDTGREPFGAWIVAQVERHGLIGDLVKAAKADRNFPRTGSPDDVRKHLNKMQAYGDMFEAVNEAETDWMAY